MIDGIKHGYQLLKGCFNQISNKGKARKGISTSANLTFPVFNESAIIIRMITAFSRFAMKNVWGSSNAMPIVSDKIPMYGADDGPIPRSVIILVCSALAGLNASIPCLKLSTADNNSRIILRILMILSIFSNHSFGAYLARVIQYQSGQQTDHITNDL
jgi:hypothetical protein